MKFSLLSYLLKVNLLFLRIGVIKPHDQPTFKQVLVVLIEQCGFSMANVQEANRRGKQTTSKQRERQ